MTSRFIRKNIRVLRGGYLDSWVTLDKFLHSGRPQFLYLLYGDNNLCSSLLTKEPWAPSTKGLCKMSSIVIPERFALSKEHALPRALTVCMEVAPHSLQQCPVLPLPSRLSLGSGYRILREIESPNPLLQSHLLHYHLPLSLKQHCSPTELVETSQAWQELFCMLSLYLCSFFSLDTILNFSTWCVTTHLSWLRCPHFQDTSWPDSKPTSPMH